MSTGTKQMVAFDEVFPEHDKNVKDIEKRCKEAAKIAENRAQAERDFQKALTSEADAILKDAKKLDLPIPFTPVQAKAKIPKNPKYFLQNKILTYGENGSCIECGKDLVNGDLYIQDTNDGGFCECLNCLASRNPDFQIDNKSYVMKIAK